MMMMMMMMMILQLYTDEYVIIQVKSHRKAVFLLLTPSARTIIHQEHVWLFDMFVIVMAYYWRNNASFARIL
jgi:hypothetical protein